MSSPTQRTLKQLRKEGWTCQVVEKWNPYGKVRVDLFGIIDIVAIKPDNHILGVQATSQSNVSSRIKKSLKSEALGIWLESHGAFEVWGWAKKGKRGKPKHWQESRCPIELTDKGRIKAYPGWMGTSGLCSNPSS